MHAVAIIPARYDSTRFPGKAIAMICGKPMVCWVADGANSSGLLKSVIIASDDQRVINAARVRGYEVRETSPHHQSGSDRVWEVAQDLDADIIVNVQGDEPTITGEIISACLRPFEERDDVDVVTLARPVDSFDELKNPNVVKVVRDDQGFALYFSRSPIPYPEFDTEKSPAGYLRHIGIYAYKRDALQRFCETGQSMPERLERLEQLRGLSMGLRYYVVKTDYRSIDVNTPADLVHAEEVLRSRTEGKA